MLPEIAAGDSNKIWIIPSEFTKALDNLGNVLPRGDAPPPPPPPGPPEPR